MSYLLCLSLFCRVCCSECAEYYRNVVSLGPGAATLTALIALVAMLALLQYKKRKKGRAMNN